ncbi:MAG: type II toxin-antitoxin system HicB family antitoxin [Ktedonobacterales bacterium]|nr:type II toxin-antitoxin system HicB family antitoxin [Ktedonobacterales bacterium]
MRYVVLIESSPESSNLGAYVPDLPGCVATGDTREEVLANMRRAIALHLEGMRETGEPIPAPTVEPE